MSFPSRARAALTLSTLLLALLSGRARAQDGVGSIAGRVLDAASGEPVEGASVSVTWPPSTDGAEPRRETRITAPDGTWEVTEVPGGTYTVRIEKTGYKPAQIARFVVKPGESARADLSLMALVGAEPDLPPGVEEFVVVGTKAEAIEASRADSDQLLNTLSAEEFSKFAASDVADALKFVPGVNVVKGQFAIIRGLEDRYSSTLYNGAPIPSPDPDRQSVPLDLFPSEVVTNLVVAKTFAPELPSNSSGGSIDIITREYPEGLEVKASAGLSLNSYAADRFLDYDKGSSVGRFTNQFGDVLGNELGLSILGSAQPLERELRYKLVLNREVEWNSATGWQESREAERALGSTSHSLSVGELPLSDGRYDLTTDETEEQTLAYGAFGFDIDEEENHKLDVTAFWTKKEERAVEFKEDGFIPGGDYESLRTLSEFAPSPAFDHTATVGSWLANDPRQTQDEPASRGQLWYTNASQSTSYSRDRDLIVTQLNGDHTLDAFVDGLHVSWAGNYAKTTQEDLARGSRLFFEPTDVFTIPGQVPATAQSLGPGRFASPPGGTLFSGANVDEHQYFGRVDADYTWDVADWASLRFNLGGWYENAKRSAEAQFLQTPQISTTQCTLPDCQGSTTQFVIFGDTQNELGHNVFLNLGRAATGGYAGERDTTNDSKRLIRAGDFGMKATLWDQLDLLGGMRLERIMIESNNDPFTGVVNPITGAPATFPTTFLFFERLDNPAIFEVPSAPLPGTVFNDEILGVDVPINPATGTVDLLTREQIEPLVNGEIDETKTLPSFGLAYRPQDLEGLTLRAAFSQTVARPSFREMSYYVTVEPGSDDLIVGNPQLKLSDVESYDVRGEYTWGDVGDLAAVSLFYKRIDDPIESLVIRDPINRDPTSSALFRTFFNNPNVARLWGVELEGRKNLEFVGLDFARYFSLGANFTYIDARVGRTEAEISRMTRYYGVGPPLVEKYSGPKQQRRLFGQPKWIANADLSFDHPDWGTKATLALFSISDILDAAGVANIDANNEVYSLTIDRYVDSFSRLDLILTQTLHSETLDGDLILKFSAKNLTNTPRRLVYDPSATAHRIPEREYKVGRDYKLTLTWAF